MTYEIRQGDVIERLRDMPADSVQCVVTSPPYWGLRDYRVNGQIGLERTVDAYVAKMVEVFNEVRRVLRHDGTLWLNMGDAYAGSRGGQSQVDYKISKKSKVQHEQHPNGVGIGSINRTPGLKAKDLIGIPWRVALALQADGWWLRVDVVWNKPNPMPESVKDRPTRAHEYIFLMSKSAKYFYDREAILENIADDTIARSGRGRGENHKYSDGGPNNQTLYRDLSKGRGQLRADKQRGHSGRHAGFNDRWDQMSKAEQSAYGRNKRNKRSVWTIATRPFSGDHFATFPKKLIEPCILAGSRHGDVVLDPFCGSGTTLIVAVQHGRMGVGIEINPKYVALAHERIRKEIGVLAI